MGYLKLIFRKAFGPVWTVFGIVTLVAAPGADAIWGDNAPVQYIAWGIFAVVLVILLFRLLFLAPYQLWVEERNKLETLEKPDVDPLKAKRNWLFDASSSLLSAGKLVHNQWSVSSDRQRKFLAEDYRHKRNRMTQLADHFLHEEVIYQAAQDAMNRCDIIMADAVEGLPNHNALREAHEFTKNLLGLLAPNNAKKHLDRSSLANEPSAANPLNEPPP